MLLLLGTYLLPAYAGTGTQPTPDLASGAGPGQDQSLTVAAAAEGSSTLPVDRDKFTVTKAMPAGARPYSLIADTFTNNPNSPIQWPLELGAPISSGFGYRVPPCSGCSGYHKGIDITPGLGTPIQAIADGVVTEVGYTWEYGVYAVIQHQIDGQTISSRYAHMLEGSVPLAVGDLVKVRDMVGQVGNTGLSTGPHVHFEILLDGTIPTDPYAWMKERIGS